MQLNPSNSNLKDSRNVSEINQKTNPVSRLVHDHFSLPYELLHSQNDERNDNSFNYMAQPNYLMTQTMAESTARAKSRQNKSSSYSDKYNQRKVHSKSKSKARKSGRDSYHRAVSKKSSSKDRRSQGGPNQHSLSQLQK